MTFCVFEKGMDTFSLSEVQGAHTGQTRRNWAVVSTMYLHSHGSVVLLSDDAVLDDIGLAVRKIRC